MSSFSERVRERLQDLDLNPFEAARRADLERNFINDILNGKKQSVRGANLVKLSYGLKTTGSWLMEGTGAKQPGNDAPAPPRVVPIMGFVGAGAEISPEFEQVPPEGLDEVQLSIAVPDEIIGFAVRGDSMLPRFREGDVILVWREMRRDVRDFIGHEAVVRTRDGRRFVKNILRGPTPGTFTLDSHNARAIEGVSLSWVGEIYLIVPATQLMRVERAERVSSSRRRKAHAAETEGMEELPLERDAS